MNSTVTRSDLISLYQWFRVVRVAGGVLVAVGIAAMWQFGILDFKPEPILLGVIPVLIASSFVWWVVLLKDFHAHLFLPIQIVADLAIISVGISYSGGVHSNFVFLYLVPIISAALISLWMVVGISCAALACYLLLIVAKQLSVATRVAESHVIFGADDAVRAGVLVIIMMLMGFQSHYYFREARKKENAVVKIKDEFLFRTVHDLRSPSNAIRWIVEKFTRPEFRGRYPEVSRDIDMIQDLNARMLALLQDLGEVVKGEKSAMVLKREPVDIRAIVRGVASELERALSDRKVRFTYDPPGVLPPVWGDAPALKEVFMNLIDNGVKYNREGGSLEIRHELKGGNLITIIADTGLGISAQSQNKLFTLYFRGDIEKNIPGTGLGLYLVKKLVELMQGSIVFASKLGEGTVFTLSLPIASAFIPHHSP